MKHWYAHVLHVFLYSCTNVEKLSYIPGDLLIKTYVERNINPLQRTTLRLSKQSCEDRKED